jgi:uncharacterized protein (DUF2249 family)
MTCIIARAVHPSYTAIIMIAANEEDAMKELNVTTIAPRDRHPLIFRTFDDLAKGGEFLLVNDHDPKPLYYSFLHEREGLFGWEYLAEGPEEWKVRISKK